jgi:PadR family transcriptional regulator PadR
MAAPRMTHSTLAVLKTFLDDPNEARYGLQLCRLAKIKSGTLYPILDRLETEGWIVGEWEDVDPSEARRPRRRLYRITPNGAVRAEAALRDATQRITPASWATPGFGFGG